jgi:hypothetical protein
MALTFSSQARDAEHRFDDVAGRLAVGGQPWPRFKAPAGNVLESITRVVDLHVVVRVAHQVAKDDGFALKSCHFGPRRSLRELRELTSWGGYCCHRRTRWFVFFGGRTRKESP